MRSPTPRGSACFTSDGPAHLERRAPEPTRAAPSVRSGRCSGRFPSRQAIAKGVRTWLSCSAFCIISSTGSLLAVKSCPGLPHRLCRCPKGSRLARFPARAGTSSDQLGVQGDFGVEDLGDGAVLLGLSRHGSQILRRPEFGTLARRVRAERLMRKPLPSGSRVTAASVLRPGGGIAGALQAEGERHRKAAGVRGGDEFLGGWCPSRSQNGS